MDLDTIGGALQALPPSIQSRIQQAASSLIGSLTKVPAAWIDAKAQSISDKAAASREIEKMLLEAAKNVISSDNQLLHATVEAYLPSAVKKARNKANVLYEAAEQLKFDDQPVHTPSGDPLLDEDWLNMFSRQAEDASTERMRTLLGRILAGEIRKPRSFSPSTLRIVAEMDTEMADDLQRMGELTVGDAIFTDEEWSSGDLFMFASRLVIHGFVTSAPDQVGRHGVAGVNGIVAFQLGNVTLVAKGDPGARYEAPVLLLTKTAIQLMALLPSPSDPFPLIASTARLIIKNNPGMSSAELILPGGQKFAM